MSMNSIITLVLIILIHERRAFAVLMNESVCFINEQGINRNNTWCITELKLCGNAPAYDMSVNIIQFERPNENTCDEKCLNQSGVSLVNHTSEIPIKCNGQGNCSLADISVPSTPYGGILTLTFACNNTDDGVETDNSTLIPITKISTRTTESNILFEENNTITAGTAQLSTDDGVETDNSTSIPTTKNSTRTTESYIFFTENNTLTAVTAQYFSGSSDSYTVAIVVSVVVPIVIVVVVVSILMYRRGQCQLLLGKCTIRYAEHSPDRTDTHVMSSNLYCDLNRDIYVNDRDVDYCEIDQVGKESDLEYVN